MPNAGQRVRALDLTPAQFDEETASGTTGSTSYTATLTGGTACAVVFVAPTSGMVRITNTSRISNSGTAVTYCSFQLLTGAVVGSGSTILGGSDSHAILHEAGAAILTRNSVVHYVSGLTAGDTYNCQQLFRVVATTGTFVNKTLAVEPCP